MVCRFAEWVACIYFTCEKLPWWQGAENTEIDIPGAWTVWVCTVKGGRRAVFTL